MILKDFQKTLLHSLNECRFSLIKHSRQMGVSTVLKEFIIETLLNENDVTIILFNEIYSSSKEFLNKIRLDQRIISLKKDVDSVSKLVFENGNIIKIASNLDGLRGYQYTHVVIDNGCFINKLEPILSNIIPSLTSLENSKLIIASSNKKGFSYFNQLFNDDKNIFTKTKLHWSVDEENFKKYEEYRNFVDDETFKIEMDLDDVSEEKLNKDHLLSFRVNNSLYTVLTKKLLDLDLSLSEYLRTLINKDTNE
jgi:hypothetical protein